MLESNQNQMDTFKRASERSDRKIKELEIKEAIVQEERVTLQLQADRKVQKISKEYIELYKNLDKQFNKYKEFIVFELESHEQIKEGLEKIIKKKEDEIDELKEALSVPRQHYKFIDNLQADQIVEQKDKIVLEMADNMGLPAEQLLAIMYKAETARKAKAAIEQALKDDARAKAEAEENGEEVEEGQEENEAKSPSSPDKTKKKLGADTSAKTLDGDKTIKKTGAQFGSANKLQRDLSVATIMSRATAETMEGSLIAPPFKFGTQK